jgi:hypothetical protein
MVRKRDAAAGGGYPQTRLWLHDLWEWDGRRWVQVAVDGPPSQGGLPGMTYDDQRNRLVLFGGGGLKGTWERAGATWVRVR